MANDERYIVEVDTTLLPENFKGPKVFRKIKSHLSTFTSTRIGSPNSGDSMSLKEAEEIAESYTDPGYVDGRGQLRSRLGKVVNIKQLDETLF